MSRSVLSRWLLAGVVTFVTDGLFATVQTMLRHVPVSRLWQGVASVPLGPSAMNGGMKTVLIGLLLHLFVAFFWSGVFVLLFSNWSWLRRVVESRGGVFKVAAVYGPAIWLFMSLVVIPLFTHRPPVNSGRWWVQFFGHAIFVGLPIVAFGSGRIRSRGYNLARA